MRTKSGLIALVAIVLATRVAAQGSAGDERLVEAIAATVQHDVNFSIFDDVNASVIDRAVTLTGRVTMPFKRDDIGKRVAKIDGVRSVVNDIQVLPVSGRDAELRVRIARAIYSHPAFWHDAAMVNPPIHIVVEHAHVTLTGCVNSQVERMLAYALAQVDGALDVKNALRLDRN
jgi:osmotically-inducible protein OsmY